MVPNNIKTKLFVPQGNVEVNLAPKALSLDERQGVLCRRVKKLRVRGSTSLTHLLGAIAQTGTKVGVSRTHENKGGVLL